MMRDGPMNCSQPFPKRTWAFDKQSCEVGRHIKPQPCLMLGRQTVKPGGRVKL